MDEFDLDWLLNTCNSGMNLTIFSSRYGGDIVGVLTAKTEHSAGIEDSFSGGDEDWASVRFSLPTLGWFPIVLVNRADEVFPAMREKLKQIATTNPDNYHWRTCVEWIGALIERDKHWNLLRDLSPTNDLCDLKKAYDILGDLF